MQLIQTGVGRAGSSAVTQLKQHQATKKLKLPTHLVGGVIAGGLLQQSPN